MVQEDKNILYVASYLPGCPIALGLHPALHLLAQLQPHPALALGLFAAGAAAGGAPHSLTVLIHPGQVGEADELHDVLIPGLGVGGGGAASGCGLLWPRLPGTWTKLGIKSSVYQLVNLSHVDRGGERAVKGQWGLSVQQRHGKRPAFVPMTT